jgi:hypothetical protein
MVALAASTCRVEALCPAQRPVAPLGSPSPPSSSPPSVFRIPPPPKSERRYGGFNLFHGPDLDLFRTILRGEFTISGFQARQLRGHLADLSGPQLARCLTRLRTHGLIKKIGKRYKYYRTALGSTVATAALKLREVVIIPMLNQPVAV